MSIDLAKITRFEVIDHTECEICGGTGRANNEQCENCFGLGAPGRSVVFWNDNKQVDLEIQDDGRTLKVFIHQRHS